MNMNNSMIAPPPSLGEVRSPALSPLQSEWHDPPTFSSADFARSLTEADSQFVPSVEEPRDVPLQQEDSDRSNTSSESDTPRADGEFGNNSTATESDAIQKQNIEPDSDAEMSATREAEASQSDTRTEDSNLEEDEAAEDGDESVDSQQSGSASLEIERELDSLPPSGDTTPSATHDSPSESHGANPSPAAAVDGDPRSRTQERETGPESPSQARNTTRGATVEIAPPTTNTTDRDSSGEDESQDHQDRPAERSRPRAVAIEDAPRHGAGPGRVPSHSAAVTNAAVQFEPVPIQELTPERAQASSQIESKLETMEPARPQMVRGVLAMTRTNGGSMTMKLHPESLGQLRIQMSMTSGRVSVQFHTETAEARTLLQQNLNQLRHALESQGLKLEQITMQPLNRSAGHNASGQSHDSPGQQQDSSRHDAGEGRSRGRFDHESGDQSSSGREDSRHDDDAQGPRSTHTNSTWRETVEAAVAEQD